MSWRIHIRKHRVVLHQYRPGCNITCASTYYSKLEFSGSRDTRNQEGTHKLISLAANQIRVALSHIRPQTRKKNRSQSQQQILKERRKASTVLPSPSRTHIREEATFIRRAQTNSILTQNYIHYIHKTPGFPSCLYCGGYPTNQPTYALGMRCISPKPTAITLAPTP